MDDLDGKLTVSRSQKKAGNMNNERYVHDRADAEYANVLSGLDEMHQRKGLPRMSLKILLDTIRKLGAEEAIKYVYMHKETSEFLEDYWSKCFAGDEKKAPEGLYGILLGVDAIVSNNVKPGVVIFELSDKTYRRGYINMHVAAND